jgi:hypothetical protein
MKQKSPDKILVLGFHAWFLESNNTAPEKQREKVFPRICGHVVGGYVS